VGFFGKNNKIRVVMHLFGKNKNNCFFCQKSGENGEFCVEMGNYYLFLQVKPGFLEFPGKILISFS